MSVHHSSPSRTKEQLATGHTPENSHIIPGIVIVHRATRPGAACRPDRADIASRENGNENESAAAEQPGGKDGNVASRTPTNGPGVRLCPCRYARIDATGGELTRAHVRVNNSDSPRVDQLLRGPFDRSDHAGRDVRQSDAGVAARQLNGRFVTERQTGPDCTGSVT